MSEDASRHLARQAASSIAMQAPCPTLGVIGWAASPSSVTRPSPHLLRGFRSRASFLIMSAGLVASISAGIGQCQFLNRVDTSALRPSGASDCEGVLFLVAYQQTRPRPMGITPNRRPDPQV